ILVVDDEPALLNLTCKILGKHGFNVISAENAEKALDILEHETVDLLITDILMPEMNGYELCIKLQDNENTKGIPVIFLSALNEINEKIKAFETGGVDFISKPYQSAEVLARVQTHLKLRRLQINLEAIVEERTQELAKRNKELIEANKEKSNFLANINHELRTPLNCISGLLSVLDSMDFSESERYFLDMASSSAKHLSSIIQDILTLPDIDSGRLGLFNNTVRIEELIKKTVNILTPKARKKGLEIIVDGSDYTGDFIGDRIRITEILEKLLSNAIKFSKSGTIGVSYTVDSSLKLIISDTGIGIPKNKIDKLFIPFNQLEDPYTKMYEGIGIGLAIIKNILDLMGGKISVESEVGRGSVFTVHIPNNIAIQKIEQKKIPDKPKDNRLDISKLTLLIAEDESINRLYLKNILKTVKHRVLEAKNGKEAVEITISEKPDLIFMDIGMPVMNGVEATKQIRKTDSFSEIPIIALTAHTHKKDIEHFLKSGLNEVITKPFQESDIHSVIRKYS
ncbi:MAG: response regulator, partial [Spirochaetales bacterium]|nr:response regulator [Spirochaetales bacterium]